MTPDDTSIVLQAMRAMWPQHTLTDEQVAIWAHHLAAIDYDDAIAVVTVLERTSKWWPHWSEFVAVYDPMLHRRREATERRGAIGERVCTAEENKLRLAECRAIVAAATGPLARGLRRAL